MSDKSVQCKVCLKVFNLKSNYTKHFQNVHAKTVEYTCFVCGKIFANKSSVKRHIIRKHETDRGTTLIKCIMCDYQCEKPDMIDHYRSVHDIDVCSVEMKFENFNEFEVWKTKVEKETTSRYIKCRTKPKGNKIFHDYRCHRDGFYKKSGRNLRSLKLSGSNKINGHCPAKIKVTENKENGKLKVNFTKTHVGHDMDLGKITLTKKERREIADKISQGTPFDEILNNIRDNIPGESLERIHLLSKKDLFNIRSAYNLHGDEICYDSVKFESWVNGMEEDSNDSLEGKLDPDVSYSKKESLTANVAEYDKEKEVEVWKTKLRSKLDEILDNITNIEECKAVENAFLSLNPTLSSMDEQKLCNFPKTSDEKRKSKLQPPKNVTTTFYYKAKKIESNKI